MRGRYLLCRIAVVALSLVLLVTTAGIASAQTSRRINWERMQRDLDIMEGILKKLLTPSSSEWNIWSTNPRGLYFAGYGVVFQVDTDGPQRALLDARREAIEKQLIELKSRSKRDKNLLIEVSRKLEEPNVKADFSQSLELVKDQLVEFFGTYADAIGQLRRSERITVLAKLNGDDGYYDLIGGHHSDGFHPVYMLEASAKKRDIIEYRRGHLTEEEFRQRVLLQERTEDDARTKNLEIMSSIMKTALNKKYHKQFGTDGHVNGIHLDGLGVLFFMKGDLEMQSPMEWPEIIDLSREKGTYVISAGKKRTRKSEPQAQELLRDYKDALIQVVGDYGHTLRTVKSTEYVVVAINFRNSWGPVEVPKRLIMRVRKRDLDRYNRGTISLSQFKRKVRFREY